MEDVIVWVPQKHSPRQRLMCKWYITKVFWEHSGRKARAMDKRWTKESLSQLGSQPWCSPREPLECMLHLTVAGLAFCVIYPSSVAGLSEKIENPWHLQVYWMKWNSQSQGVFVKRVTGGDGVDGAKGMGSHKYPVGEPNTAPTNFHRWSQELLVNLSIRNFLLLTLSSDKQKLLSLKDNGWGRSFCSFVILEWNPFI